MSSDDAILLDALQAARRALEFKGQATEQEFLADLKTQSAVLHQLLLLGEAVKRLSKGSRDQHPEVPWKPIAGMRDILIHQYDRVDLGQVWRTLTVDIPSLVGLLQPLVPKRDT